MPEEPEDNRTEEDEESGAGGVQFPSMRINPVRWLIAVIVVAGLIIGLRALFSLERTAPGETVTAEGASYSAGDVISQPFEAKALLKITLDMDRVIELSPGASIRFELQGEDEGARFTLLRGMMKYSGPPTVEKVYVDTNLGELSISNGRVSIELWGGGGNERLRVGMLSGLANFSSGGNETLVLSEGDAAFAIAGRTPQYLVDPVNSRPGIDPKLDAWVFPDLTHEENPTVGELIEGIGNQVGLRVMIPTDARFANPAGGDMTSLGDIHKAGELLDELALQWGFEVGLDEDVLVISPLDEARHLGAIGERVLFAQARPSALSWPRLFSEGIESGERYRFDNVALLAAAPYEQRLGALAMLVANRIKGGGEYAANAVEAELALAFDISQPYALRRLAFQDLYENADIAPEKIVPQLQTARVEIAGDYFRIRVFAPPAWGDPGVWTVYEDALGEKSKDDESRAGLLYQGMYSGKLDYATVSQCVEHIWLAGNVNADREVVRYFYDLAVKAPKGVDPSLISIGLRSTLHTGRSDLVLLSLDALRIFSKRLEENDTVPLLIDPYTNSPDEELSRYAAAALGTIIRDHPYQDEDRQKALLSRWVLEISDPGSKQGSTTLSLLGLTKGLDTEACYYAPELAAALETRLGKTVSDSPERLLLLRLIRAQRQALGGDGGLKWAEGVASRAIGGLLSDNDADFVVESVFSLGLDGAASADPASEPDGLRTALNNAFVGFAGHQDARLRWLSVNYVSRNKPSNGEEALEKLAGDEFPAIAKKAKGEA